MWASRNDGSQESMWVANAELSLRVGFPLHGCGSSLRDWAADQTNHPLEIVEATLAHVVANRTEAGYARSDPFKRRRRLMDDWAAYLGDERGQVVPLRR